MIDFKIRKFKSNLKKISLSHGERAYLRASFLDKVGIQSEPVIDFHRKSFNWPKKIGLIAIFSAFFFGFACMFVSAVSRSTQGDFLYPIKENVMDVVRDCFNI